LKLVAIVIIIVFGAHKVAIIVTTTWLTPKASEMRNEFRCHFFVIQSFLLRIVRIIREVDLSAHIEPAAQ